MMNSGILLGLFIFFGSFFTSAQEKRSPFQTFLTETNLVFTTPTGYTLFDDTSSTFVPKKTKYLSALFCTLQNDHESINISISLVPFVSPPEGSMTRKFLPPDFDINKTFKNSIIFEADTIKSKVRYYNQEDLKKVNASKGAEYDLAMDRIYLDKYIYCKVLILQRDNIGEAFLYYFYNDKTKDKVDAAIKQTCGILKFRLDSEFKPILLKRN